MSSTKNLSREYWNQRYTDGVTGWDMGEVSPPIKAYVDQLKDKTVTILIPGAGNSYEAEYMFKRGFSNIHLLDYAEVAMNGFKKRNPEFPRENIHVQDFFEHKGSYDLIIEQTLFCAIDPDLRQRYADKVAELIPKGGKLVGLMFDCEFEDGPPFGGNIKEYKSYFSKHFSNLKMDPCYNSTERRQGIEIFIRFER